MIQILKMAPPGVQNKSNDTTDKIYDKCFTIRCNGAFVSDCFALVVVWFNF